jgi:membrane protein implicated in regulation of membrane protease activity
MLAGMLVIAELFTGTFYLLMIAAGLAFGALAAWFGASLAMQVFVAAIVGVIATDVLRRSKLGKRQKNDAAHDPNVNLDIGQTVAVEHWTTQGGGRHTARALYRGTHWDVELAPGASARAGLFVIIEIRGSRLIVAHHTTDRGA